MYFGTICSLKSASVMNNDINGKLGTFTPLFNKNVPHILETIFFYLDYDSFIASRWVCLTWYKLLFSKKYKKKLREKRLKKIGYHTYWTWDIRSKPSQVWLTRLNRRATFFPLLLDSYNYDSFGTAGVRGTHPINNSQSYWEIDVSRRTFGTNMMFGIGSINTRLNWTWTWDFHLIGETNESWGLSHKGYLLHNGIIRKYTLPFEEGEPTTIGLHFDGEKGTLTYYKNGISLGIAFENLNKVNFELFPIICSSAQDSHMTLTTTKKDFKKVFCWLDQY